MKIGDRNYSATSQFVDVYNCAMGELGPLVISQSLSQYVDTVSLAPHALGLAKEFLVWVRDPPEAVLHRQHWGMYNALSFLVFHDNIKSVGEVELGNPLYDMSSFLEFISKHEKELGCRVIKTPMVDNYHHSPKGSHPGRVWVLIPPYAQVYEPGVKLTVEHKKGLSYVLKSGYHITEEDRKVITGLV